MRRTQWAGCHGRERHGGDRGCGGHNRQDVMVGRDMTEIAEEVIVSRDMKVVEEDTIDRVS